MSQPQSTLADVDKAKAALSQLMQVRYTQDPTAYGYTQEEFDELVPYMDRAISDANVAIRLAEYNIRERGSTDIDLGAFQDPQNIFRSGYIREEQQRAVAGAREELAYIQNEIGNIDTELTNIALTPERRVELEERKRLLQQDAAVIQSGQMFQARRPVATKPLYLTEQRPEPAVMQTLRKDAADAEFVRVLAQTEGDREAAERARQEVYDRSFAPLVQDVAGGPSRMAKIAMPELNIDIATGTYVNPVTGETREATPTEIMGAALRPQVTQIRSAESERAKAMQQRQALEQAAQRGELLSETAGQGLSEIFERAVQTPSRRAPDVLVESPAMYALRVAFAMPSALTGLAAEAVTYDVDAQGNPIDPMDLTYKVQDYLFNGMTPAYGGLPLLGVDVENVPERRNWADASSTFNLAASSIADGVSFYEIKQAMPAMNVEDTEFDTLRSTILGATALGLDFLTPSGPAELATVLPRAMRKSMKVLRTERGIPFQIDWTLDDIKNGDFLFKWDDLSNSYKFGIKTDKIKFTPLAGTGEKGIINVPVNLDTIDDWLKGASEVSLFGAFAGTTKATAGQVYKYELNRMIDEAFTNRSSMRSIGGWNINNVQDAAAREIAYNLTDLTAARIFGKTDNTLAWTNKTLDNYAEWSNFSRIDVDNPFRVTISVAEAIAQDIRVIREGLQALPKSLLYTSVFRNNLIRAAAKSQRWQKNPILKNTYRQQSFDDVPEYLYKAVIKDEEVVREAVYRTLRDVTKEQLYNRLPIDMMFVAGGRRIIHFAQFNERNQLRVAAMMEVVNNPQLAEGGFRLGKNVDEQVELFIDGVGIDQIRQSDDLKRLLDKLNKNQVLTPQEYALYQDYIEAGAWSNVLEDAYEPTLMSQAAYTNATELRSNDVFLQRSEQAAMKYLKASSDLYTPKAIVKAYQRYRKTPQTIVSDRAGLAYVNKLDKSVYITPKPYLDMRDNLNALRSTEYDSFNARLEDLMGQGLNGGEALGVAMNESVEIITAARQSIYTQRYLKERQALISGGMEAEAASEAAMKSIMLQQDANNAFNSYMAGRPKTKDMSPTENIRMFIVESTRKEVLTDYFDKFFYLPEANATAELERLLRRYAQDFESPITPQYLYYIHQDIMSVPQLKAKLEFNNLLTLKLDLANNAYTTEANLETGLMFTLSLRSKVRYNSEIERIMTQYPSLYIDMVVDPTQTLLKQSQPERLVLAAREEGFRFIQRIIEGPAGDGSTTMSIDNVEDMLFFLLNPRRDENVFNVLDAEKINTLETKVTNKRIRTVVKQLDEALDASAKAALFSTAGERTEIANSMIQGMIMQKINGNNLPTQSFVKLALAQDGGDLAKAFVQVEAALDNLKILFRYPSKQAKFNTERRLDSLRNVLLSNTMGLNMSYTGNMSDLSLIKTNAFANTEIATTPLQLLEYEIDQVLRSYGIVFGPEQYDDAMRTMLENYRPVLSNMDISGINMFMGKEFADTIGELKNLAQGADFRQALDQFREVTRKVKTKADYTELQKARVYKNALDALARIQMTGLLGGAIAPNIPYLAQNLLTMPFIMVTELGVDKTLSLTRHVVSDVMNVAMPTFSTLKDTSPFIRSRTGRIYTLGEYKNLLTTQEIATTFSSSQFAASSLAELVRTLRADSELIQILDREIAKGVKEIGYKDPVSFFTTLGRYADPRVRTYFTMLSHVTDMNFRRAVFAQALEDGMTPAMAAKRSREALYDYGRARETARKQALGKWIGFFSFFERSLSATFKAITTRRNEALKVLRLQDIYNKNQEGIYVGDSRQMSRVWQYMVDTGTEKNLYVGGPLNPLYESFALIVNTMAFGTSFVMDTIQGKPTLFGQTFNDVIDRKPLLPLYMTFLDAVLKTTDLTNPRNPYDANTYLPASYMSAMTNRPTRQLFMTMFNLEPVAPLEARPTYRNQMYRFADKSGYTAFVSLELLMSLTTIHRFTLDALKTAQVSGAITQPQYDRGYYHAVNSWTKFTGDSLAWKQLEGAVLYQTTILRPELRTSPEGIFLEAEMARKQQLEALK